MSNMEIPFEEMDVIGTLVNDGIEQGYLTYDQILERIPEIEGKMPVLEYDHGRGTNGWYSNLCKRRRH